MESSKWQDATDIYKNKPVVFRDMTKKIYRNCQGFEAFVIGEATEVSENDCWIIEGNGVKSKIWKSTSKKSIVKVPYDYELRKFTYSN